MSKSKPVMDWQAIKAEVHRRGMTLTELAIRSGLHSSLLRKLNTTTHYEGQATLAAFIEQKPSSSGRLDTPGTLLDFEYSKIPPVRKSKI